MRKYLPITLILLAALTGQAFGAESQWQGGASSTLTSLARLAQSEASLGAQCPARIPSLTVLAGGLTVLVWISDADSAALSASQYAAAESDAAAARCPAAQSVLLPPPQHRMRPPVDRGP